MNDQELLTYAAKAVGYGFKTTDLPEGHHGLWLVSPYLLTNWDPLQDSGHAFELMIKLHMCIRHLSWLSDDAWKIQVGVCMNFLNEAKCGDEPLKTARRAIVEMAAEIGKAMK
jgi:hypothetical protein